MEDNEMKTRAFLAVTMVSALLACQSRETSSPAQSTATTESTASAERGGSEYDLQFIDTMKSHHQTAVQMGQMAQQKASDAKIKAFGRNAADDQTREVQQMEEWRRQWYPNAPDAQNMQLPGAASMSMDMSHMQSMSGPAFDMMFVDMMIPHHQGAIEMSRDALQKAQRKEVRDFARQVITKQEKEITELQNWKKAITSRGAGTS
jgi:uncharacterized protein (DUF305 family)